MFKKFTLLCLLLCGTLGLYAQIQMPMPNQTGTFSGNARGYYFTAPTCFTITGVEVPTDASSGAQSIAIMRLPAAPPLFSATTNVFTTLFLTQNSAIAGQIPVNIQVEQGDIIGVLAVRANVNSYATGPASTTINSLPVTLNRLGMQFPLATTSPQQLWTEASGSISRCWLYYTPTLNFNTTVTPVSGLQYAFTSNADTSFSIAWDFGDGNTSTQDNPTHTYASTGTYNVCAYITTSCGVDTICQTLIACPALSASYGYQVSGMSISLQDSTVGADSSWFSLGDGTTINGPTATYTYTVPDTYSVCVISGLNCGTRDTVCTDVVVCAPPVAAGALDSSAGLTLSFASSSTYATSYFWDFGDGTNSTQANPSHTYLVSGSFPVTLIVSNFCGSDTLTFTANACATTPSASFLGISNLLDVTFSNSTINATGYLWNFGDGQTSTTMAPTHTYALNGTYVVCLTATNACGDQDTECDTITVCGALTPAYTYSANALVLTFTNTSTGGSTYVWDFGDGQTSTFASPVHTYSIEGTYSVCLYATDICGNTDTTCQTIVVNNVAVRPSQPGFVMEVNPNPMTESTTVFVSADGLSSTYTFELTDLQGRKVLAQEGQFGTAMTVHRNALAQGVYLYKVVADGKVYGSGRLVMQ
jgi:PKD repeat protein